MKLYTFIFPLMATVCTQLSAESVALTTSATEIVSSSEALNEKYADITIASFTESLGSTYITLNNQVGWKYHDVGLFDGLNGWGLGDRIEVVQSANDDYYLQNMSSTGIVPVSYYEAPKQMNVVSCIEKNQITQDGVAEVLVVLGDNSRWYVSALNSDLIANWAPNDRIMVSPSEFTSGAGQYLLINVDRTAKNHFILCSSVQAQLVSASDSVTASADSSKRDFNQVQVAIQAIEVNSVSQKLSLSLTNGMQLQADLPNNIWAINEPVVFTFNSEQNVLFVRNAIHNESVPAVLLSVDGIQSFNVVKASGHDVVLGNGSAWYIQNDSLSSWSENNRVAILPAAQVNVHMVTHLLLNLDHSATNGVFDYVGATLVKAPLIP